MFWVAQQEPTAAGDARSVARRRHMHYAVEPEYHFEPDGAKRHVGVRFRLMGAHQKRDAPQPGCILCRSLDAELRSVALAALEAVPSTVTWDLVPFTPALYWSPPDECDEVSLVFVGMGADYSAGLTTEESQAVRRVRQKLEEFGVTEGAWQQTSMKGVALMA